MHDLIINTLSKKLQDLLQIFLLGFAYALINQYLCKTKQDICMANLKCKIQNTKLQWIIDSSSNLLNECHMGLGFPLRLVDKLCTDCFYGSEQLMHRLSLDKELIKVYIDTYATAASGKQVLKKPLEEIFATLIVLIGGKSAILEFQPQIVNVRYAYALINQIRMQEPFK